MRIAMLHRNVALHVFDDHDGVVDDQPRSQRDAKERQRVDGEAEELDEGKGSDQRNWNGDGGDDGGAPVKQEEEDDGNDDEDGKNERLPPIQQKNVEQQRGGCGGWAMCVWP